jgi:hypothetical protein
MAVTMETLHHSNVDSNMQNENNFSFLPVMESAVRIKANQTRTLHVCPINWFRNLASIQLLKKKTTSNQKITYNNGQEKEHSVGCNISTANSTHMS